MDLHDAELRKLIAEAELARLNLAEAMGEVVPVDDALRGLRARMLPRLPAQPLIPPLVVGFAGGFLTAALFGWLQ